MKFFLYLLMLAAANAQTLSISCGSTTDQYYVGGVSFTNADLSTLRYAPGFGYSIPLKNGLYLVTLRFEEPNQTAVGKRLFSVNVNGQQTENLDLYKLAGGKMIGYSRNLLALVGAGTLKIQFSATVGNAVITGIDISPAALTVSGLVVSYWPEKWQECKGMGDTWDCAGLFYLRMRKVDGSDTEILGIQISASYPIDVSSWQSVN